MHSTLLRVFSPVLGMNIEHWRVEVISACSSLFLAKEWLRWPRFARHDYFYISKERVFFISSSPVLLIIPKSTEYFPLVNGIGILMEKTS
jgi:hypothetical protein